jgi:uncharacterized metal-binding protein YceD (DUF177 family)
MRGQVPPPEFSRRIEVARVPKLGSTEKISADPQECMALAKRLDVPAVFAVEAILLVKPWRGGGFRVTGDATIDLQQTSVVSLEDFRSQQTIVIERYFLDLKPGEDDETHLDIDQLSGGEIDIGEVVAETIALELDPYPRKPGEVFAAESPEPDVEPEKSPNPFNVLKLVPRDK